MFEKKGGREGGIDRWSRIRNFVSRWLVLKAGFHRFKSAKTNFPPAGSTTSVISLEVATV